MPRLSSAYQALLRSYIDSLKVNAVSWAAEALFCRLLVAVDGSGRFLGRASDVAGKVCTSRLGRSTTVDEIESLLRELEEVGLIVRWSSGPERFLQVVDYFDAGNKRKALYPEAPEGVTPSHPLLGDDHPLLGDDHPLLGDDHPLSRARARTGTGTGTGTGEGSGNKNRGLGGDPAAGAAPPRGRKRPHLSPQEISAIAGDLRSDALDALLAWNQYRQDAGLRPLTAGSWGSLVKRAAKDPALFAASVEHSIGNGYQGIYAPGGGGATRKATAREILDRMRDER